MPEDFLVSSKQHPKQRISEIADGTTSTNYSDSSLSPSANNSSDNNKKISQEVEIGASNCIRIPISNASLLTPLVATTTPDVTTHPSSMSSSSSSSSSGGSNIGSISSHGVGSMHSHSSNNNPDVNYAIYVNDDSGGHWDDSDHQSTSNNNNNIQYDVDPKHAAGEQSKQESPRNVRFGSINLTGEERPMGNCQVELLADTTVDSSLLQPHNTVVVAVHSNSNKPDDIRTKMKQQARRHIKSKSQKPSKGGGGTKEVSKSIASAAETLQVSRTAASSSSQLMMTSLSTYNNTSALDLTTVTTVATLPTSLLAILSPTDLELLPDQEELVVTTASMTYVQDYWYRLTDAARRDGHLMDPIWDTTTTTTSTTANPPSSNASSNNTPQSKNTKGLPEPSWSANYTKQVSIVINWGGEGGSLDEDELFQQLQDEMGFCATGEDLEIALALPLDCVRQLFRVDPKWQFGAAHVDGVLHGGGRFSNCPPNQQDQQGNDDDATYLRSRAHDVDAMDVLNSAVLPSPATAQIVPRAWFVLVELIRTRSGLYHQAFRKALCMHDVQVAVQTLEQFLFFVDESAPAYSNSDLSSHKRMPLLGLEESDHYGNEDLVSVVSDDVAAHSRGSYSTLSAGGGCGGPGGGSQLMTAARAKALVDDALAKLHSQWPHPPLHVLKVTGVVKLLKRGASLATLVEHRRTCWDLLQYWQDLWELGRLTQHPLMNPSNAQQSMPQQEVDPLGSVDVTMMVSPKRSLLKRAWRSGRSVGKNTNSSSISANQSLGGGSSHNYASLDDAASSSMLSRGSNSSQKKSVASGRSGIVGGGAAASVASTTESFVTVRQREAMERAINALIQQSSGTAIGSNTVQQGPRTARHGKLTETVSTKSETGTTKFYVTKTTHRLQDLMVPYRGLGDGKSQAAEGTVPGPSTLVSSQMARIFADYGIVLLQDFCTPSHVAQLRLEDARLTTPSNPMTALLSGAGPTIWDRSFNLAVRVRPGNRLEHRFPLDQLFQNHQPSLSFDDPASADFSLSNSAVALMASRVLHELPAQLFPDEDLLSDHNAGGMTHSSPAGSKNQAGGWRIVSAGILQALGRNLDDGCGVPPPQQWHSDGPSLFTSHHHPTYCFHVHIPLVMVTVWNGAKEFVPGTHEDQRYRDVIADFLQTAAVAQEEAAVSGTEAGEDTFLPASTSRRAYRHIKAASIVRAELQAGHAVVFDTRILHRGLPNQSLEDRPVLYFTLARDWYAFRQEKDDLAMGSIVPREMPRLLSPYPETNMEHSEEKKLMRAVLSNSAKRLCHRLYGTVTGRFPPEYSPDETKDPSVLLDYGHKHYTTRFDLLLMERLISESEQERALAMTNVSAILAFGNLSLGDKEIVCREFLYTLDNNETIKRKRGALVAQHLQQRKIRTEKKNTKLQLSDDVQHDSATAQTPPTNATDSKATGNVNILYDLAARLLLEETTVLSKFGFTKDDFGLCAVMSMLKAHIAAFGLEWTGLTVGRIEEAFSCFWNGAESRSRFQAYLTSFNDIPKDKKTLLVAFSGIGPLGFVRPEWTSSLRAAGLLDLPNIDVLHVMDFASSWYCQDPTGQWRGGEYFESELQGRVSSYRLVAFLGEGMGGSAALRFSALADIVLSFSPHLDLVSSTAVLRKDFPVNRRKEFLDQLVTAVYTSTGHIMVHYSENSEEDERHIDLIPPRDNVKLKRHRARESSLSSHLKKKGELSKILRDALSSPRADRTLSK